MILALVEWINRYRSDEDFYFPERMLGRTVFFVVLICFGYFLYLFDSGGLSRNGPGYSPFPFVVFPLLAMLPASTGWWDAARTIEEHQKRPNALRARLKKLLIDAPEPGPFFPIFYLWGVLPGIACAAIIFMIVLAYG